MTHPQLPLSKVKRIAKFDPDVKLMSSEAVVALSLATETFVRLLSKEIQVRAASSKRVTMQMKDFDDAIKTVGWLEFLDGTLDGWEDGMADSEARQATSTTPTDDREEEDVPLTLTLEPMEDDQEEVQDGTEVDNDVGDKYVNDDVSDDEAEGEHNDNDDEVSENGEPEIVNNDNQSPDNDNQEDNQAVIETQRPVDDTLAISRINDEPSDVTTPISDSTMERMLHDTIDE